MMAPVSPPAGHLLFRSSNALMLNTVLTSALGIGYWVVAARLFSPGDVGRGSALVSTMIILSSFAQLNLTGALVRFLPVAGAASARFIRLAYGAAAAAAVVLSATAVAVLPRLVPDLAFLATNPATGLTFCVGVAVWTVFNLQDAVLTGIRAAEWVPLENTAYGLLKLVALVPLLLVPGAGILLSWVLPLPILVVAVNVLVFRRYLAGHVRATRHRRLRAGRRVVLRFVAVDYVGSVFTQAVPLVLPLLVLSVAGADHNAYFYVAWVIATGVMTLAHNLATALTVEAAHHEEALAVLTRRVVRRGALLGLPVLFVLLAAPSMVLSVFGGEYGQAVDTLRLLALSTVPRAVLILFSAIARVRNQVALLLLAEVVAGVLTVVLALWWVDGGGAAGVSLAWLVGQTAVALAVLPYLRRHMAAPRPAEAAA